jgi:hypothetical protein
MKEEIRLRGFSAKTNLPGYEKANVLIVDEDNCIWGVPVKEDGTDLTITSVTPEPVVTSFQVTFNMKPWLRLVKNQAFVRRLKKLKR